MSRATELNFRNPREIADAIYHPDITYDGKPLNFRTSHVSAHKIQKVLPFRSSEVRLPFYHGNERRQSPFVGPSNYEHQEAFNKIHPSPCIVKFKPDSAQSGNECFTMVGNQRVYIPAFEKPAERRRLIESTKDLSYLPRASIPKSVTNHANSQAVFRQDSASAQQSNPRHQEPQLQSAVSSS